MKSETAVCKRCGDALQYLSTAVDYEGYRHNYACNTCAVFSVILEVPKASNVSISVKNISRTLSAWEQRVACIVE